MTPKYDCRRIFTDEEEKQFVDYIDERNKFYYGITISEFLKVVYTTGKHNGKKMPDSWEKNERAGKWRRDLIKPNCVIRNLIQYFNV